MILVVALAIALAGPDDDLTNMVAAPEVAAAYSTPTPVTTNAISLPFLLLSLPPLPCPSIWPNVNTLTHGEGPDVCICLNGAVFHWKPFGFVYAI